MIEVREFLTSTALSHQGVVTSLQVKWDSHEFFSLWLEQLQKVATFCQIFYFSACIESFRFFIKQKMSNWTQLKSFNV